MGWQTVGTRHIGDALDDSAASRLIPIEPDDGFRLLVCRYWPRGLRKEQATWDAWDPSLAPSKELHAAWYGKHGISIDWPEYKHRYLMEMKLQACRINELARRVAGGKAITLLCSSACTKEQQCHRILLKQLVEVAMEPL